MRYSGPEHPTGRNKLISTVAAVILVIDPRAELPAPTDERDAHGSDQQLPADERRDQGSEQRAPSADLSTISQVNDGDREQDEGSRSGDE